MRYLVNNTTKHNTYCSFSTRHLSSNENGLWYLSALLSIIDDKMTMPMMLLLLLILVVRIHNTVIVTAAATTRSHPTQKAFKNANTCMRMNRPVHHSSVMYTFNLSFVCIHLFSSGYKFHGILIEFIEAIPIQPKWAAPSLNLPLR